MKKLAFAIQVFSLIAMFPVYVIAEFNHATRVLPANNTASYIKMDSVKRNTQPELNIAKEIGDVVALGTNKNRY